MEDPDIFAGGERCLAAGRVDFYDPADEPAGLDGRPGERRTFNVVAWVTGDRHDRADAGSRTFRCLPGGRARFRSRRVVDDRAPGLRAAGACVNFAG